METLSIIIPVRNRAKIVTKTLDSIVAQTYRPLNVILVDNASTDDTYQVLCNWCEKVEDRDLRVTVIQEEEPGATLARNAGLAIANTDWTMFFDSDDIMHPKHVERAMRATRNPNAKIIGWDVEIRSLSGATSRKPFTSNDPLFNCIMHGTMATQRYMARTKLFRQAGGWRNDVKVWNDIELGVRLLQLVKPNEIVKVNGPLTVKIISQADSITGIDYSHNGDDREHALDCIEANLPQSKKWIANLKRCILAANYSKEKNKSMAQALLHRALRDSHKRHLKIAYFYTRQGGRGAARLLRPFIW